MTEEEKFTFNAGDRSDSAQDTSLGAASDPPPVSPLQDDNKTSNVEGAAAGDSGEHSAPQPDPAFMLLMAGMEMAPLDLIQALIAVFSGHAWIGLGLHADPRTGETNKDLPKTQLAIDVCQFLLSKLEGKIAEPESREFQRRLTDLRMNYLAKIRET